MGSVAETASKNRGAVPVNSVLPGRTNLRQRRGQLLLDPRARLNAGTPGDQYEQEADRMADSVMQSVGHPLHGSRLDEHQPGPRVRFDQALAPLPGPGGQPLPVPVRRAMENRFGRDLSPVRIHDGPAAQALAQDLDARAFTFGKDIFFAKSQYQPDSHAGWHLLAHELTHVVQQSRPSAGVAGERRPLLAQAPAVQCQRAGLRVRSPVAEEAVAQSSDIAGAAAGRRLTPAEQALARPVFAASIDLDSVRLVTLEALQFRTVGNNIYVPPGFTISDSYMAQTLIHELTHVWQYQHGGTSYISESLAAQIGAAIARGSRNFAYDYQIRAGQSFFDFNPEQQGLIVENYFAMQRDLQAIPASRVVGSTRFYQSNHFGANGFPVRLQAAQRLSEIASELPLHEALIKQMRAALPQAQVDLLRLRASDVIRQAQDDLVPPERQLAPMRPLFEIQF